jgi:uncharacterized NAD-dependent epimerase/dehydratase family protein
MRGSCPTHLVLCHRAGMTHLDTVGEPVTVPPLNDIIALYEDIASACGTFTRPVTVGIAVNTAHLDAEAAARATAAIQDETGRLAVDPVRDGAKELVNALMSS